MNREQIVKIIEEASKQVGTEDLEKWMNSEMGFCRTSKLYKKSVAQLFFRVLDPRVMISPREEQYLKYLVEKLSSRGLYSDTFTNQLDVDIFSGMIPSLHHDTEKEREQANLIREIIPRDSEYVIMNYYGPEIANKSKLLVAAENNQLEIQNKTFAYKNPASKFANMFSGKQSIRTVEVKNLDMINASNFINNVFLQNMNHPFTFDTSKVHDINKVNKANKKGVELTDPFIDSGKQLKSLLIVFGGQPTVEDITTMVFNDLLKADFDIIYNLFIKTKEEGVRFCVPVNAINQYALKKINNKKFDENSFIVNQHDCEPHYEGKSCPMGALDHYAPMDKFYYKCDDIIFSI